MRSQLMVILLLAHVFLPACQSIDGPQFDGVLEPPAGEALVYIYKPLTYGKSIYRVYVNGNPVTELMRGGYYPHTTPPGEVLIVADKQARLGELLEVFDIESDKTVRLTATSGLRYYVKIVGALDVRLIEADEATALSELPECKLLSPYDAE